MNLNTLKITQNVIKKIEMHYSWLKLRCSEWLLTGKSSHAGLVLK